MKVELKDLSHGEERKDWTYTHDCKLKVTETDDSGSVVEKEEYGYIMQGKDMIFLNFEKIYLPNLPTEHQDVAGAFEELLEKLQGGEGGEDWQPPDWWIPVPEPGDYDIYILINAPTENAGLSLILANTNHGDYGTIICDWGDGTNEELTGVSKISHVYNTSGQFLVHIVCSDKNNFISSLSESPYGAYYLIIKTGSKIFGTYEHNCTYTDTSMLLSLKSYHPHSGTLSLQDQANRLCPYPHIYSDLYY